MPDGRSIRFYHTADSMDIIRCVVISILNPSQVMFLIRPSTECMYTTQSGALKDPSSLIYSPRHVGRLDYVRTAWQSLMSPPLSGWVRAEREVSCWQVVFPPRRCQIRTAEGWILHHYYPSVWLALISMRRDKTLNVKVIFSTSDAYWICEESGR